MRDFSLTWWTWLPGRLRRGSLLREAWSDGIYFTAWPRAAVIAPLVIFLIGLIEGATHWGLLATANGSVSASIHAIDFAQMLPLLFVAVICGIVSGQFGLLLVTGFALGDLFIAGPAFHPYGTPVFQLYASQLVSYLAFFTLAVTPALTAKVMVQTLPLVLRRNRIRRIVSSVLVGLAVAPLSVYAWTLGAPMIVRIHWLWARETPPLAVTDYVKLLNPWLPLAAAIAVAMRTWLSIQAEGKALSVTVLKGRAAGKTTQSESPISRIKRTAGPAFLSTVLICGLFNSPFQAALIFAIILGFFVLRQLVLPRFPLWVLWSRIAGKVPLVLRWAGSIAAGFLITRSILLTPSFSANRNGVPGEFGPEIFAFLVSLAVALTLLPGRLRTATPSVPPGAAAKVLRILIFSSLLVPAARAYADICLDPECCFGGDNLLTALAIAALILLLLALILVFFPELLGLAAEGTEITAEGLAQVIEHLAEFGEYPPNTMMVDRLQAALDAGELLTGADENFYLHELYEAEMMSQGMEYDAAHQAALDFYSHSPFSLYPPEVIQALPEYFNSNWLRYWGLMP